MTTIDTTRSLHTHMFSYIRQRNALPGPHAADVRAGFLAWLAPNGHTITQAMRNQLAGYNWIDAGNFGTDFANFAMTNLPGDGEAVAAYVLRYQFDRLENRLLVDDAARAAILTNLVLMSDSNALTGAWNAWLPTDPANGVRTFPQRLSAFKIALLGQHHVPTSNAVATFARAQGFDVQAWADQQLETIADGHGANDRWLPKLEEGLACWNWALTGFTPMSVTPDDIFTWLCAPLPPAGPDPTMPARLATVTEEAHVAARDELVRVKQVIHANRLDIDSTTTHNQNWHHDPNLVALVRQLNQRVYLALVTLYGMTVVSNSSMAIGVECIPTDGVSWEHWWVEILTSRGTVVIETFPVQKFSMNATALRQVERMDGAEANRYQVMRIPVQNLLPAHHERIGLGLIQYL